MSRQIPPPGSGAALQLPLTSAKPRRGARAVGMPSVKPREQFMALDSLRELFLDELKDLYDAEKQLLKALPKMAKASSAPELRSAFEEHLEITRGQVDRMEQVFELLGEAARGKKCKAMQGLVEEGSELIEEKKDADPSVLDAGLIAAAQRVEHYEMAGYGCVRTFAKLLGEDKVANLLQATLDEEGEADQKLTELAETVINIEALEENGEDEDKIPKSSAKKKPVRAKSKR
jgi:ferritin-like metal-binding protein YciE